MGGGHQPRQQENEHDISYTGVMQRINRSSHKTSFHYCFFCIHFFYHFVIWYLTLPVRQRHNGKRNCSLTSRDNGIKDWCWIMATPKKHTHFQIPKPLAVFCGKAKWPSFQHGTGPPASRWLELLAPCHSRMFNHLSAESSEQWDGAKHNAFSRHPLMDGT